MLLVAFVLDLRGTTLALVFGVTVLDATEGSAGTAADQNLTEH